MKRNLVVLVLAVAALGTPVRGEDPALDANREAMVSVQLRARGIRDERVLAAMRKVPRHHYVPPPMRPWAYTDQPLPIGEGQTISQPYIVAFMTETLALKPAERVLEIGTGSGYQAALLGELVGAVFTIEILPELGRAAEARLRAEGYTNIWVKIGDGYLGWPEQAPFDAILVTCAPDAIPPPLITQLKEGGRMIIPVGPEGTVQELVQVRKQDGTLRTERVMPVRFVPMTRAPAGQEPQYPQRLPAPPPANQMPNPATNQPQAAISPW